MAERAPSARKQLVKSKRTLRKRGECAAALPGGFRTSPQVANVRKCALLGHSRRTKAPPRNAALVPKRAFSASSPYARGRMRLRLILFSEVMRARPARCASVRGRAERATRALFARLALDIRLNSQALTEHRTKPARYAGLIFFHSETP